VNKTYFDANKGTGDALLAGGLTEAAPQEFTGFNNFTEDTHFDENIDADDTLTLNGSSAAFRIAGLSMTSGDTATLTGGNKLDQLTAGFYGNSIYQISGPVTPLAPAWYSCVFHQTGVNDIIRTEGKAQMATAPTVGDDLCNKTYVDAAAGGGGSVRAFQLSLGVNLFNPTFQTMNFLIPPAPQNPYFTAFTEPSTLINNFSSGVFTATADDVGWWNFSYTIQFQANSTNSTLDIAMKKAFAGTTIVESVNTIYLTDTASSTKERAASTTSIMYLALGDSVYINLRAGPALVRGTGDGNLTRWCAHKL
jgi:hypothetical protein